MLKENGNINTNQSLGENICTSYIWIKNWHPKYRKNTHNSIVRKQTTQFKNGQKGTSLVAQWLRIHLPMWGTWVRALVQEDPTCCGATKPVRHNY